jgi:prevent-host-death family protein
MQTVNMHQAKTHLSRYVDLAAGGEEILIARAGKPVARLVALATEQPQQRPLGLGKERFKIPDQFDTLHQDLIEQIFPTKT